MAHRQSERRFYLLPFSLYLRLIRWAFERFYREFAWTYDAVAWLVSRGLWRTWVFSALPYVRGRVLELGCGPGHLQQARRSTSACPTIGVDRSPFMLAQSARRLRRSGFSPLLLLSETQHLPLPAASFDTIVATFPAEYIRDPRTHAEILRLLTPDGRLILVLGAEFLHHGILERLIDLAFRLTLQRSIRPSDTLPELPFTISGMHLQAEWVMVGPSRVLLVVGTKGVDA